MCQSPSLINILAELHLIREVAKIHGDAFFPGLFWPLKQPQIVY